MSLLDKDKKIKNSSKKDKKTNDLIKNTLPLDEGMIIGFYPSDKNELKNNIKLMSESVDGTKDLNKKENNKK